MPAAISLWFYRLEAYASNGRTAVPLEELPGLAFSKFLGEFVDAHRTSRQHDDLQRVWYRL
jgi:hypothetical protein